MAGDLCGNCTLCCKLLGVRVLDKPPGSWCPSCDPKRGCRRYDTRPDDCHTYSCLYHTLVERGEAVPPELRLDRCGVIIDAHLNGVDHTVRPDRPGAWQDQRLLNLILILTQTGHVYLAEGERLRELVRVAPTVLRAVPLPPDHPLF